MTADGALDWPAWDRLLDFHVREGTDGIVVAGTTGESPVLSVAEIEELTRRAVARCRGKIKVIVGAGTNATDSTVARTRALSRLGVDAVMLVTPYYNKPPQEGLFRHFTAAADASAVPVILYNVPSRTAVDLLPGTVARLARHPRIVAIKEATASLSRAREILERLSAGVHAAVGRRCHRDRFDERRARAASFRCRRMSRRAACTRPARLRCRGIWRQRGRLTRVCSLYIRICSSKRVRYPSNGRWREWGLSGTQSACRWSNWQRRTMRRCCARCGPPELPLRTKLHEF